MLKTSSQSLHDKHPTDRTAALLLGKCDEAAWVDGQGINQCQTLHADNRIRHIGAPLKQETLAVIRRGFVAGTRLEVTQHAVYTSLCPLLNNVL